VLQQLLLHGAPAASADPSPNRASAPAPGVTAAS
jgi:hypothetical protein